MLNQATHLSVIPRLLPRSKTLSSESLELDRAFRDYYVQRTLPVTRAALGIWVALVV